MVWAHPQLGMAAVVPPLGGRRPQEPLLMSAPEMHEVIPESIRSLLLRASIAPLFIPGLRRMVGYAHRVSILVRKGLYCI
jgi:hypothetical protein